MQIGQLLGEKSSFGEILYIGIFHQPIPVL
ncbi:Uncharacterised protein [Yersinia mollaretii]|nr:Uncharacterised protein [Yersinia mollaretii]CQH00407.1 Uncharacterised protein [Yersinia mollaretii]